MRALFILVMLNLMSCSGEQILVTGRLVYFEPFPFASPLGHHAADYKQKAALVPDGTEDTLVVLFDYSITRGVDAGELFSVGKRYEFVISEYNIEQASSDNYRRAGREQVPDSGRVSSLPIVTLVDSTRLIRSAKYWLVSKVEKTN